MPQKCFLYTIRIFFLNLGHSTSNRRQVLQGFLQYLLCFPKNKNHVYFILFLFPTPYEVREMLNIEEEKIKQISFGLVEIGQIFSFALFGEYAIDKRNVFWFKRGVGERLPQFVFVFLLLILSTHQIINFVLFLTSSFERTELICSVIFSCFISFPTNRLSQRSPPEQIHYFRYFTSPRFKLGHFYNCRTYFQCSGSYWRQRWREAARRWC